MEDWDQFDMELDDWGVEPPPVEDQEEHNALFNDDDQEDEDPEENPRNQGFDNDSIGNLMGSSCTIDPSQ